ncbi:hypothetical protein Nepgr_002203 [Nepenthes gracilis]|uniref:BHLH domain-containing protein n=1 Tax=Nepenthes gracilis TaxID=150966 RepID=A0AAD3RXL9_NEPGR|nr:hypothetical protein Nepgr_002203 [Nepenthes gracilis]
MLKNILEVLFYGEHMDGGSAKKCSNLSISSYVLLDLSKLYDSMRESFKQGSRDGKRLLDSLVNVINAKPDTLNTGERASHTDMFNAIGSTQHLFEGNLDAGCSEEENFILGSSYAQLLTTESFKFEEFSEEKAPQCTLPSFEDKMPFLQMLRSVEAPLTIHERNLQFLLILQQQEQKKQLLPWDGSRNNNSSSYLTSTELESCVTNNDVMMELQSPVKSDAKEPQSQPPNSTNNLKSELNQDLQWRATKLKGCNITSGKRGSSKQNQLPKSPPVTKERRKRKRTRPLKNKEEVESQRITHIAVERNRRRQMNDHLNALRSMMPPSYVQRGDQASIIGGAIDFVKELEQLLQSLQAHKRMRQQSEELNGDGSANSSSSSSSSNLLNKLFVESALPLRNSPEDGSCAAEPGGGGELFLEENRSAFVQEIEAVVIHNHVNLKIECRRRAGLLVKTILALEDLRLTVLHLNITSFQSLAHYSFNLKIEDDCQLRSADEIEGAVHQIFNIINGC